jgi:hypothetical protein
VPLRVEFIDENGGGPDVRPRKDRRNLGDHQYDAPHGRALRGQRRQPSLTWRAGNEFIGFR